MVSRRLVVGIDEAGYGPNLGPLVIAASVWEVPDSLDLANWLESMAPEFQSRPLGSKHDFVPLGDSKVLYQAKGERSSLAQGVMALLASCGESIADFDSLLTKVRVRTDSEPDPVWGATQIAGDASSATSDPTSMDEFSLVPEMVELARKGLARSKSKFLGMSATMIFEPSFNSILDELESKGKLLSRHSLLLVKHIVERFPNDRLDVYCDKHGGRNRYQEPLLDVFPDRFFMAETESANESRYRDTSGESDLAIRFSAKGDRFPATAAASMLAKWCRELFMERLNQFWSAHLPGLKSTAGYPEDAKRFEKEIQATAKKLGIKREQYWRRA